MNPMKSTVKLPAQRDSFNFKFIFIYLTYIVGKLVKVRKEWTYIRVNAHT